MTVAPIVAGSASTNPPGSTTSTSLVEHTPTGQLVGPQTDSSDFFGIFVAVAVVAIAIVVIRRAFYPRRRPDPIPRPSPGRSPTPDKSPDQPTSPPHPPSAAGDEGPAG